MAIEYIQASDQIGSAGAKFAADRVVIGANDVEFPVSKITIGADGAEGTLLTGGAGVVDAGCLRVALATDAAAVTGPVTDTELRATPVVVDLGANNDVTVTSGTLTNLSQLGGVAVSLNTGVRDTGTQRVTIATDDVVPASQSGVWNVTNVSGTVSLPTGASTEATLSTLDGKVTACNTGSVVLSSGTVTTVSTVTNLAQMGGVAISLNTGVRDTGTQRVTIATDDVVQIGDNSASLTVDVPAISTGGATPGKLISAATTNSTSVKASAATVYSIQAFNTNAAARYLKIYNKASAATVGTDVPVQVYTIPGNTAGAGLVVPIPSQGIALSTGFAFALTTGAADNDTGAVALNEIVVSYSYA